MKGIIDTIPLIGVRGDVLIETRDSKTGRLAQRSEGHNLFTNYGLERFRQHCAMGIGGQFGRNMYVDENLENEYYKAADQQSFGFLKYLYLTDNEASIAATDRRVPGTLTALATRAIYAGSATNQGNINMNETVFSRSGLKAVFDFGTDRGNGTHKSIFWADRAIDAYNAYSVFEDSGCAYPFARQYNAITESNDGYFYGTVGTTLYKIDPTTHEELTTYTLPAAPVYDSIFDVSDGICVFTTVSNNKTLYVFTLSDSTSTTKTLPNAANSMGGALFGNTLYYTYNYSTVYAFNITDSTNTSKIPAGVGSIIKAMRRGSVLLLFNASNVFYVYDYTTNTPTATNVTEPINPGNGNVPFNTFSLAADMWQLRFITCYNSSTAYYVSALQKISFSKISANMITGKVLDTPITKLNTQTMKVTYTISFV